MSQSIFYSIFFFSVTLFIASFPLGLVSAQVVYTPEELHKHFQTVAEQYEMQTSGTTLSLRKQPLMHWRNPERQQDQGALYVWEKNGRPQVLASIFTYEYSDTVYCRHEMISLADGPLVAELDSEIVWSPNRAGLEWRPCDGSAAPAETDARRLFQMRSIARQFSGTLSVPNRQISQLTLLPQPLVRYQSPAEGVIDGAVFSLAVGTDPELLLVIEAKKVADGSVAFMYAPARSHYHALELKRNGNPVWSAEMAISLEMTRAGQRPWSNDPFFVFTPKNPLPLPEDLR